ncbi:MAG: GPP34 family phosphoprotein [Rhodoglobus sp.]
MDADANFTLAEAVALVGAFDFATGRAVQPGIFSSGNIFLAEPAALLIDLADSGSIRVDKAQTSRAFPGSYTTRVVVTGSEPTDELLREVYQLVAKQKPRVATDSILAKIATRPIHNRLREAGLVSQVGRLLKQDVLTNSGVRVRDQLCEEINEFISAGSEADVDRLTARSSLIMAVLLAGYVAGPLYLVKGQDREEAIEREQRLVMVRQRVSSEGDKAPARASILTALQLANASYIQ